MLSWILLLMLAETPDAMQRRVVARLQTVLGLKVGAVVADIGSGDSPDLSMEIVKIVGASGKVIYVDIDAKALEKLERSLQAQGVTNVRVQLGKPGDPGLPRDGVDAVLIVFAYHEMAGYRAMLARLRESLRPDGRLAIIEASTDKARGLSREGQVKEHELSPETVEADLRASGFEPTTETLTESDGVRRYLTWARRVR
jgi:ubiquinone/menaquinone biosynthesis C-methylase UbiE